MFKRVYAAAKEVVLNFLDHNCSMHAAGLTYFALLAVVPVLCCILVTAKVCGVDRYARNEINRQIDTMIATIEEGQRDSFLSKIPGFGSSQQDKNREAAREFVQSARDISNQMFSRIESFDVGAFGWIGFGFLLWTVISSLASVETSFNEIFAVPKPRPIWKRAYMYLFIMVAMPVMGTVAVSLPILNVVKDVIIATLGATWLTKWVGDGIIWLLDSLLFRFALTVSFSTLFFAFFFWIIPNCKVKWRCAVYGGLGTSVAFGGWLTLCAQAQVGIAKSSALYGSFAFLPIVLAWLYMSWQIVLIGACVVKMLDSRLRPAAGIP